MLYCTYGIVSSTEECCIYQTIPVERELYSVQGVLSPGGRKILLGVPFLIEKNIDHSEDYCKWCTILFLVDKNSERCQLFSVERCCTSHTVLGEYSAVYGGTPRKTEKNADNMSVPENKDVYTWRIAPNGFNAAHDVLLPSEGNTDMLYMYTEYSFR